MRILKPTTQEQELKVIPRSYPERVDIVLTNEETNEQVTLSDLSVVSDGGYLNVTNTFSEVVSGGVKCIAANNEYLSSPAGNYFGSTITGLDLEVEYQDLDISKTSVYFISQGTNLNLGDNIYLQMNGTNGLITCQINSGNDSTPAQTFTTNAPSGYENGKIGIKENAGNIEIWFNDLLLSSTSITISDSLSDLVNHGLFFGATFFTSTFVLSGVTFTSIKIGSNEWTFPEGTGSTTANSQGVVTTLHSDVDVNAMWLSSLTPYLINDTFYTFRIYEATTTNEIYYGKIFVTDQPTDSYSIQDGTYQTITKDNEYIIYGK